MTTASARKPSSHAVQAAGLHFVAAEAILRGFKAEIRREGQLGWVQVGDLRVEVHIANGEWPLTGHRVQPEADLVVFILRGESTTHEYFIATRAEALAVLDADMTAWRAKQPNGTRPRNPDSTEQTLRPKLAEQWRDRWELLAS